MKKVKEKTMGMLKSISQFVAEFTEDIYILIGIMLIVAATLMMFGIAPALYVLGGFFLLLGVIDPHAIQKKGGENNK